MASRKVPIVVWGAQLPQQLYVTIGSDNVTGGFLAAEHLILKGRKQIAFFGDIQFPEVAQRYEGYCKALSQYGIKLDQKLVVAASFSENGAELALKELQNRKAKFNGLFACSDLLATSTINQLRVQQIQVPQDVAVVGYDDIELARYFHPPLTTIRQPILSAGQAMVDALLEIIDGKAHSAQLLSTELIARSSS
jgi:DNA-binding LacI/PurR family transcriptional regulator